MRNQVKEILGEYSVLVADNLKLNRLSVGYILGELDIQIAEAEDGVQALEFVKSNTGKKVLLLLDLLIPNIDGHEVIHNIRSLPELSNVRIIVQGASPEHVFMEKSISKYVEGYIQKPFGMQELCTKLLSTNLG